MWETRMIEGVRPCPRDPAIIEAAAKHARKGSITHRPADLLKPEWDELRAHALALADLP